MRFIPKGAAIALLATLAACSAPEPSAEELINDASDMAASIEQAEENLPAELRNAADTLGEMPCSLPALPDASKAQPMNVEGKVYNTASEPAQVGAFYLAATQARGGTAATNGPAGMAEILIAISETENCRVVAQALMTGGSNVQITPN